MFPDYSLNSGPSDTETTVELQPVETDRLGLIPVPPQPPAGRPRQQQAPAHSRQDLRSPDGSPDTGSESQQTELCQQFNFPRTE